MKLPAVMYRNQMFVDPTGHTGALVSCVSLCCPYVEATNIERWLGVYFKSGTLRYGWSVNGTFEERK